MIDYVLESNFLTEKKSNDRWARVVNTHSYSEEDLAEAIARRNMGISKPEALAMLEAATEIQLEWLLAGSSINLRLAHFHPSVPGTYEEGEYPKEAAIRITPSKEVAEAAKTIPLRHVEPVTPMSIDFIHDVKSNTTNNKVTCGGTVKITGHNLKIAGKDPTVGAEFISVEDPEAIYRIPAIDIIVNNPSELLIVAPQMVSKEKVVFKITTQFMHAKKDLKSPRSITFAKELTVI
ncbi:MAG: DUF4469 domain-containing protein [Dysgonamonadaceae bacterium]|jgi:hypothetical protein|nr:DUF4469 domain-containing protein [Dysgonamonadaceae bacterium]